MGCDCVNLLFAGRGLCIDQNVLAREGVKNHCLHNFVQRQVLSNTSLIYEQQHSGLMLMFKAQCIPKGKKVKAYLPNPHMDTNEKLCPRHDVEPSSPRNILRSHSQRFSLNQQIEISYLRVLPVNVPYWSPKKIDPQCQDIRYVQFYIEIGIASPTYIHSSIV